MGFDFRASASKSVSNSPLCENRNKVDTDDIIKMYPDGVTIVAADLIHTSKDGEEKTYPVLNIAEDEGVYFNGGTILNKIVTEWAKAFNGDIDAMNGELVKAPVKVKLSNGKTRANNNIVLVDVL